MTKYPIANIKVRRGRHRQELGDLASLIESIRELGLLHPIVIAPNGTLVAGQRRLVACQSLGMTEVPVRVVAKLSDAVLQLQAERDENICRLSMKPSELVALGLELEKLEKPKAQARIRAAQNNRSSGNFPQQDQKGETREVVGQALGWSGRTYQEAKKVVIAASDPDAAPEVRQAAQRAVEEMDASGKVSPAYRKVAEAENPTLRPKHPKPSRSVPTLVGKKPKAGERSVRQCIASLQQAALDVDAVASTFETDGFGKLDVLVAYPEAHEWLDLLAESAVRLSAYMRTVKRYREQARKEASA